MRAERIKNRKRMLAGILACTLLLTGNVSTAVSYAQEVDTGVETSTLKGEVWLDANGNGQKDEGETGLNGTRVALYHDVLNEETGEVLWEEAASAVTEGTGAYCMEGVEKGSYTLVFSRETEGRPLSEYEVTNQQEGVPEAEQLILETGEGEPQVVRRTLELTADTEATLYLKEVQEEEPESMPESILSEEATEEATEEPTEDSTEASTDTSTDEDGTETPVGEDSTEASTDVSTDKDGTETPVGEDSTEGTTDGTESIETTAEKGEPTEALTGPTEALTMEALAGLDMDTVGAAYERDGSFRRALRLFAAEDWSFSAYYVGVDDRYHVEKTDDFNIKYQMEFHNSRDLEAGDVEIRIPVALLTNRDGQQIRPTDIAVPPGTPDAPVESSIVSFNHYIDEETGEMVFFNYEKILSGSNIAFQVLYKNLKIMEIPDETTWEMTPKIKVKKTAEEWEEKETTPLTGRVDSEILLSKVTKTPYSITEKSYTPGLYTERQVSSILGEGLPEKYRGEQFNAYRYVVWEIELRGSATQPYDLTLQERTLIGGQAGGEVVGFSQNVTRREKDGQTEYVLGEDIRQRSFQRKLRVVTAYPAEQVSEGTVLTNQVTGTAYPADGIDDPQSRDAEADWNYTDYHWRYSGDIIGVRKSGGGTYKGWLDVYREASQSQKDMEGIPFHVRSETNGYGMTHSIENDSALGQRIPGAAYKMTTVDDFVYLYDNTASAENHHMLGSEDYYFSEGTITVTDTGYDPWEDVTAGPETAEEVDQNVVIFVMYEAEDTWTEAGSVSWSEDGKMTYTLPEDVLARKPWRVKAEHTSVNYRSVCTMDLKITLRHDSPKLQGLLKPQGTDQEMTLENIAGVMGERIQDGTSQEYFHDQTASGGNYSEPGIQEGTEALYGQLIQRDSAFAHFTSMDTHAAAYKSVSTINDPINGRIHATYSLSAYDGYNLYSQKALSWLQGKLASPGRKQTVFYDLLPYGMHFDPSVEVTAARAGADSGFWDDSQVTVTVDPETDIETDYRGTGRTLIRFHVDYGGADPSVYSNGMWMEGWRVTFGAYYDWKDIGVCNEAMNICAFQPADSDAPLLGAGDEVMPDDGATYPDELRKEEYHLFGPDLDGDGNTDERNVLYAKTMINDDVALAAQSEIRKKVRADSDRFGTYKDSAVVMLGGGYTYDITVSNISNTVKDIVVFDRLENAPKYRSAQEPDKDFDANYWYGTFDRVITTGLEERGIAPVIYYHADRDAEIPTGAALPSEVLTNEKGWFTQAEWEGQGKDTADVQAVAVDLSRKADGTDFEMADMDSVSFQIHMISPSEDESSEDADHGNTADKATPAEYAYNNASFYSHTVETGTKQTVTGNSVEVSQGEMQFLEVVKQYEGEIPDSVKDTEFRFTATILSGGKKIPYGAREYRLYRYTDGEWQPQEERLFATDTEGNFFLRAGEKAVFEVESLKNLEILEEESPFWAVRKEEEASTDSQVKVTTWTYHNTFRPVLYVRKKLTGYPKNWTETELKEHTFTFRLTVNGKTAADTPYWIVDQARTDGGIPVKLGEGRTDGQGELKIQAGQIFALFPGAAGDSYELTEVAGAEEGSDWMAENPGVSGALEVNGSEASITNIYRWKDVYLTKTITHQEAADCTQAFTFEVRSDGKPLADARWVLMENGQDTETEGKTDQNGRFTAACAGKTVRIEKLEGGKAFSVKEVESGEDYRPAADTVSGSMPIYSSSKNVEITNDYLLRPISVSKMVSYDESTVDSEQLEKIKSREFTMTLEVEGRPYAEKAYTVTEGGAVVSGGQTDAQGRFTLKHGQTATFQYVGKEGTAYKVTETPDPDYPQIYPADAQPIEGNIEGEGAAATLINGTKSALILGKEYTAAEDDLGGGEAYVEEIRTDPEIRRKEQVELTLETKNADGRWQKFPESSTEIQVVDMLDGSTRQITWSAGASITVQAWEQVVVNGLEPGAAYRLSEREEDRYTIYATEKQTFLEITQKEPAGDQPVKGTVQQNPLAVIVNQVREFHPDSEIRKVMAWDAGRPGKTDRESRTSGGHDVPAGAILALRAEQYDGRVWNPAEGVSYLVGDDSGFIGQRILKTGKDGKIYVEKTETGYPVIYFPEQEVTVEPKEPKKGAYRIVEIPEETDEAWGRLTGYRPDTGEIVNTNRMAEVILAKEAEGGENETFTFRLKQIDRTLAETPGEITTEDGTTGSFLHYQVWDSAAHTYVSEGNTGKDGEVRIKGGQYAVIGLPDGTFWTATEVQDTPYVLTDLTGTEDKTQKLSENLMLIGVKAEAVPVRLEVGVKKPYVMPEETLDKAGYEVTAVYSDGTETLLKPEDYTITPETAPETAGAFEVQIRWKGLGAAVEQTAAGTTEITRADVKSGVIDAETGESVVLNTGDVQIPEMVLRDGIPYVVTGIGANAFYDQWSLTDVTFPDSITSIGNSAFLDTGLEGELRLPEGLTSIGNSAFYNCRNLRGELRLPKGLMSIGASAFYDCRKLTGDLEIPEGLTSIESSAFYNCYGLDGELRLPEGLTSIGSSAFYNCYRLDGELRLPEGLTSIGAMVFYNCSGLTGDLTIPEGVTSIGNNAFIGCSGLTGDLTIPESVTSIGNGAFIGCSGLTGDLTIPESVTSIGNNAFINCSGLDSITILGKSEGGISGSPWGYRGPVHWEPNP